MRVGVYAGDFGPEEGGAHTFVSTVLEGFFDLAETSAHEFTVFCEPGHERAIAARCASAGISAHALPRRGRIDLLLAEMRHYSPLAWALRNRPGRLQRAAAGCGIELMWFVPGLAYEALDIPYIGTIWDLQHRLLPWFPETCADGYWEHRELVYSRFIRRACHLLTGTRTGAELIARLYGVAPERISVLPQPVPRIEAGSPPAAVGAGSGEPYILYPAQFWAHKNHVNLLHALKLLEERDGLRVAAVFPGADKGTLEHVRRTCAALALQGRVRFPGFVSAGELSALYRGAAALVYPSFNGPDNLPPLEAFAHGCPVAISDYPGAEEQTGEAAVRFAPDRPEEIARAVKRILTEEGLRARLVARGSARAAGWSAQDYARGVLEVVDRLEPLRRTWSA